MVKSPLLRRPRPATDRTPELLGAARRIGSSSIRDLLAVAQQPGVISLAGGLPDPSGLPVDAVARAAAEVLAEDPTSALQYGPTEGLPALRALLAARAGVDEDRVIVTSGSQQALDLVARTLVEPGDVVAVTDPAYVGALQALRGAGAQLDPIPSDAGGMRVDLLADRLHAGLRPRLVHVVSAFDNPTGATLDGRRRVALAELAEAFGFWIVDDDPYGALRWSGTEPTSLRQLTDRTISLGSTSKVLCPGLRVGWAIGPREVVASLAVVKQSTDLHTSALSQALALRLLADEPALASHTADLRATYRMRADALADALEHRFGAHLRFRRPLGGMFVWAELGDGLAPGRSTADLLATAVGNGVAYVPGRAFAAGRPEAHDRHLRLSFATTDPAGLATAVDRLAAALAPDRT